MLTVDESIFNAQVDKLALKPLDLLVQTLVSGTSCTNTPQLPQRLRHALPQRSDSSGARRLPRHAALPADQTVRIDLSQIDLPQGVGKIPTQEEGKGVQQVELAADEPNSSRYKLPTGSVPYGQRQI